MEADIVLIPKNKIPNPKDIAAISFTLFFFVIRSIIAPIPINKGAIASNLKDTSWAVIVVPIFAPIITPAACINVIRPAFTKLTTITVVAPELCIAAVTNAPTHTPITLLLVIFSKIPLSFSPAALSKPSLINFIPNKNSPKPPINSMAVLKIFIYFSLP